VESDSPKIEHSTDPSDEELAKLAQQGDIESGNQLFIRHGPELERLARYLSGQRVSEDEAKERLQNACRTAWQRFSSFGPPYNFVGWIREILINQAKNKRRAVAIEVRIFGPEGSYEDIDRLPDAGAAQGGHDREDLARLLKAMDQELMRLDPLDQKIGIFMLRYFADNEEWPSKREIASGTGIPASTALRCRERVLEAWQLICRARGFWPLV